MNKKGLNKINNLMINIESGIDDMFLMLDALPETRKIAEDKYGKGDVGLQKIEIRHDKLAEELQLQLDLLNNQLNLVNPYSLPIWFMNGKTVWGNSYQPTDNGDYERNIFYSYTPLDDLRKYIKRIDNFLNHKKDKPVLISPPKNVIKINNFYLSSKEYILEVNDGSVILPFKSKKGIQTKTYKIFFALWETKRVVTNDKIENRGAYSYVENLRRYAECPSNDAVYRHVRNINKRLCEAGLLNMQIEIISGKYRLVIIK